MKGSYRKWIVREGEEQERGEGGAQHAKITFMLVVNPKWHAFTPSFLLLTSSRVLTVP